MCRLKPSSTGLVELPVQWPRKKWFRFGAGVEPGQSKGTLYVSGREASGGRGGSSGQQHEEPSAGPVICSQDPQGRGLAHDVLGHPPTRSLSRFSSLFHSSCQSSVRNGSQSTFDVKVANQRTRSLQ